MVFSPFVTMTGGKFHASINIRSWVDATPNMKRRSQFTPSIGVEEVLVTVVRAVPGCYSVVSGDVPTGLRYNVLDLYAGFIPALKEIPFRVGAAIVVRWSRDKVWLDVSMFRLHRIIDHGYSPV